MAWDPANPRGLRVSTMSSKEFSDWVDAGRPPLEPPKPAEPEPQRQPKIMSAEQSKLWNDWWSARFRVAAEKMLTLYSKKLAKQTGEGMRDYVTQRIEKFYEEIADEIGAHTAKIQKDLEDKIAKVEAGTVRTFNIRSTYDAQAEYAALDVVTLGGTWFVARHDNPGPCPGSGWQAGPAGTRGKPGAKIKSWKLDVPNYTATPVMSDGSEAPSIDLRPFFQRFLEETR
jgi:hypothetical protein